MGYFSDHPGIRLEVLRNITHIFLDISMIFEEGDRNLKGDPAEYKMELIIA